MWQQKQGTEVMVQDTKWNSLFRTFANKARRGNILTQQETWIFSARHCRVAIRKVSLRRPNSSKQFHNSFHKLNTKLKELFVLHWSCWQQQQDAIWNSEVRLMLWGEDSHLMEESGRSTGVKSKSVRRTASAVLTKAGVTVIALHVTAIPGPPSKQHQ